MELLVIILVVIVFVWTTIKIVKEVVNFIELQKDHDVSEQKIGMVYNEETQKLEADQSIITPF